MKFVLKYRVLQLLTIVLLAGALFSSCNKGGTTPGCCDGYTGEVTSEQAKKLMEKCNFISKDTIIDWTNRYKKSRDRNTTQKDSATGALKNMAGGTASLEGDSYSFKSCIIKKIICNEKCIGLRTLQGMSPDGKVHIIFVGIQPDYENLYIEEPEECCGKSTIKLSASVTGDGTLGGAEYGQYP